MKKIFLLVVVVSFFLFSAGGKAATITTNNASQTSFNMTFYGNENKTFWVNMPKNSSVTNAQLNLSGYIIPVENYNLTRGSVATTFDSEMRWGSDNAGAILQSYFWFNTSFNTSFDEIRVSVAFGNGTFVDFIQNNTIYICPVYNNFTNHTCTNTEMKLVEFNTSNYAPQIKAWDNPNPAVISFKTMRYNITKGTVYRIVFNRSTIVNNNEWDFYKPVAGDCPFGNDYQLNALANQCKNGNVSFFFNFNVTNPYLDVSGDGDTEWMFGGTFNQSNNRTADFSSEMNTYFQTCTASLGGNCTIPFVLHSDTNGTIQVSDIIISYTPIPYIGQCLSGMNKSVQLRFFNETSPYNAVNATMNAYLYSNEGYTYNFTATNTTHDICIYPSDANYTVYGQIQYSGNVAGEYSTRDYFLDAEIFDNNFRNLDLYLLTGGLSTRIKFTIKDQYSNLKSDVVVKIQRYYPETNSYKTVAAPRTDANGIFNTYLVPYDVYYKFIIQSGGVVLDTIQAMTITSSDITLMIQPTTIIDWIKYWQLIGGNVEYDSTTGMLTAKYYDNSGYISSARFFVSRVGALQEITMCDLRNTSTPTGQMNCSVGNITGYVIRWKIEANLTISSNFYLINNGLIDHTSPVMSTLFGNCQATENVLRCKEGLFIAFLIMLVCVSVGFFSPPMAIVFGLGGLIVTWMTGLYAITIQSIIGLVFIGLIMIFVMRPRT